MEVHLDRRLAERRFFPAIDIDRSGTRREELLLDEHTLQQVWLMRRMVGMVTGSGDKNQIEVMENIQERIRRTRNNQEFLATLTQSQ